MTSDGSRVTRWLGIVSLAGRRILERATGPQARRVWLSVGGVAIAVALMLVVTGVSLNLSAQSTVQSDAIDYWIVPESGSSTAVVDTGGTQFGDVHTRNERVRSFEGVDHSTPMLMQILRLRAPGSEEPKFVLAIGVIPSDSIDDIGGISTAGLSPGDPFYADGRYDGEWTGDVLLSPAAAELLNASAGDGLVTFSTSVRAGSLTVTDVSDAGVGTGVGQLPVALFRLSELQALTGADSSDSADQILVSTNSAGVESRLAAVYPRSTVVTRTGLTTRQVAESDLPLAVGLTAFIVALVVGTLFVATTMGLEIATDRKQLAVLAAIGFSRADRALLVVSQTLCITLVGGLFGIALGTLGIELTNLLVREFLVGQRVATFHPALAGYGLAVAVLIGLLAAPYLLLVVRNTNTLEELAY